MDCSVMEKLKPEYSIDFMTRYLPRLTLCSTDGWPIKIGIF